MPRGNGSGDAGAVIGAGIQTTRAVIDVAKHQGLASLPGFPYVWYQFRFTMMAKGLVDAAGPNVLRPLWDAFALSDEQLAGVLGGRVHPAAGHWLASWSELQGEG